MVARTPPHNVKKSAPLGFVMVEVSQDKPDAFHQCMADLMVFALFFFLRSCEYTKTNSRSRKNQFRYQDMKLHDANGVILPDAAANVFMEASAFTLLLETKNNGVCGESSTMEVTGMFHRDLVLACARHYLQLCKNNAPPDTPICNYYVSMDGAQNSYSVT